MFAHHEVTPAYGLEAEPGGGGPSQVRHLQTVLDQGTVKDLGIPTGGPKTLRQSSSVRADVHSLARGCRPRSAPPNADSRMPSSRENSFVDEVWSLRGELNPNYMITMAADLQLV